MPLARKRKSCDATSRGFLKRSRIIYEKEHRKLDVVVGEVKDLFRRVLFDYGIKCDEGSADPEKRKERADEWLESMVADEYEDIKTTMMKLFQWLPPVLRSSETCAHPVLELQGLPTPPHLDEGRPDWVELGKKCANGVPPAEKLLGARLACLRDNPSFLVREALFAILSIVSARKEKNWLEVFETQEDIESKMKELIKKGRLCKSRKSERRKDVIRAYLEKEELAYGIGFFAHFLLAPEATIRIAFETGKPLTPAALTIVERRPLWRCLASPNDDEGDCPLRGKAKSFEWCKQAGTQFAFQDVKPHAESEEGRDYRLAAKDLKPDPILRKHLLSKKCAVYLQAVASLAPRAIAKDRGHSKIVLAELARVMREAKLRGEVAVFCLGSESPLDLFKKIYNRSPICDHGLRCGYIRWRGSSDEPWAREDKWENRCCVCLQLP